MKQPFTYVTNTVDENDNPAGGFCCGEGFSIRWQNGPLVVEGERREPNGAFVEGVIAAALQRLEHYQTSKFACRENEVAIRRLEDALEALEERTASRTARGVEGSHEL